MNATVGLTVDAGVDGAIGAVEPVAQQSRRRPWLTAGGGPSLSVLQAAGALMPLAAGGGDGRTARSGSIKTGASNTSSTGATNARPHGAVGLSGAGTPRSGTAGSVPVAEHATVTRPSGAGAGVGDGTSRPTLHIDGGGAGDGLRGSRKVTIGATSRRPELQALHDRCAATVDMALQVWRQAGGGGDVLCVASRVRG